LEQQQQEQQQEQEQEQVEQQVEQHSSTSDLPSDIREKVYDLWLPFNAASYGTYLNWDPANPEQLWLEVLASRLELTPEEDDEEDQEDAMEDYKWAWWFLKRMLMWARRKGFNKVVIIDNGNRTSPQYAQILTKVAACLPQAQAVQETEP
jgi:hypothetical protein